MGDSHRDLQISCGRRDADCKSNRYRNRVCYSNCDGNGCSYCYSDRNSYPDGNGNCYRNCCTHRDGNEYSSRYRCSYCYCYCYCYRD